MKHDTGWKSILPDKEDAKGMIEAILEHMGPPQEPLTLKKGRGRPAQLLLAHLGWAIFWCFLQGWQAQLDLWREIRCHHLGHFAPVRLTDQAVYKRLAQDGRAAMGLVFEHISLVLSQRLGIYEHWELASFASEVIAVDESKLDQVGRWLTGLRTLPVADPALLAGRLSCLFDVRRQQWRRVDVLPHAITNSLVHVRTLLAGLPLGTLLLFDLGYFSFEWFDDLTRRGMFWITRLRQRTSYEVLHVFVQKDGYLDALISLGTYRADRAEYAVRLIQIGHGTQRWSYLSNVLDPTLLSGVQIAQLYRRRWDIELAFRTLKDHLHLNVLWSAKWEVIQVQILAALILAQVFHALQVEIAAQAHVDLFEVSMDLLVREVPRRLLAGESVQHFLREQGRAWGIIRPHQRLSYWYPDIQEHEITWPPPSLLARLRRKPRYAHNPGGHSRQKKTSIS